MLYIKAVIVIIYISIIINNVANRILFNFIYKKMALYYLCFMERTCFMRSKACIALFVVAFTSLASLTTQAQTSVVQSFNGTNNNNNVELGFDGNPTIRTGVAQSGVTNGPSGNTPGSNYYAPATGSTSSWGVTNATEGVLFRGRQTAAGSTGNYIQFRLAAWGLTSDQGVDFADQVNVYVSTDNGTNYKNILRITGRQGGNADGYWDFTPGNQRIVAFTQTAGLTTIIPTGNRNLNGNGYDSYRITIPDGEQYIRFYIVANCGLNELWTIDEVMIGSGSSAPLPVELKSFTATASVKGTQLQWTTASEKDNAAFEVQRGATAEQFQTIGRVSGKGTSSQSHSYEWVDKQPLSGLSYYRLRQLDYDGTESFSPVAVVQQSIDPSVASFFPNPSTGVITLAPALGNVRYRIINALGQSVLTGNTTGGSTVDMQALRAGSYFLELHSAAGRTVERLLRE
ncbi:T9SS type A sorting domain-containing protein [uncultured Hymenobacter sp.]|uniref:T9SS type A sorting domain-containing protein n=1 Tax=uncultured Hymenobacter sp. TaxID=170016 RepID=UPI0035CB3FF2